MNKRTFVRTSSALIGGAVLSNMVGCHPAQPAARAARLSNWAGNLEYSTDNVHYPETIQRAQELIRKLSKVRALGSRHSFSRIADSNENLLSTKALNKVVSLDKAARTVTVEAGITYGELAPYLHQNGFALHNLASLPHISVGGACATATHGSGTRNGNLSTAVSAIEFLKANGDIVSLSRDRNKSEFEGALVGLGAAGFVTNLTLDLQPAFDMKQVVYRNLPMSSLSEHIQDILSSGYSVSLFTDWRNKNINEVWIKSRADDPPGQAAAAPELYGATLATQNIHPVEDQSPENVTQQMGIPGPWYERMPHFKMGFKPSTGKELQSEYFVPLERAYEAIMAMEKLHEKITPHLFISEIRAVKADEFWMSPCYKQDCLAIHTTWKQEIDTVHNLLPLIEEQLAPFNPRPHWAKLFTIPAAVLQPRISRLDDFKQLVHRYDPDAKFRNEFLTRTIYSG